MIAILLHNPQLLVCLILFVVGGLFALFGVALSGDGGLSRGFVFVGGMLAMLALLQAVGGLAVALRPPAEAPTTTHHDRTPSAHSPGVADRTDQALAAAGVPRLRIDVDAAGLRDPAAFWGAASDVARVRDVRAEWIAAQPEAPSPELALALEAGLERLTLLRYAEPQIAAEALDAVMIRQAVMPYQDRFGIELRGVLPDTGEHLWLHRSGPLLLQLTAPDAAALDARIARLPWSASAPAAAPGGYAETTPEPLIPALQPLRRRFAQNGWLQLGAVVAAIGGFAWLFFAGVGWTTRVNPDAGTPPVWASELRKRLLSINASEAAVQVESLADGRLAVRWRLEQPRWLAAARQAGVRRTHRLLLRLDTRRQRVVVTEEWAEFGGAGPLGLRWRLALGLQIGQVDHRRAYALRFDADGRARVAPDAVWQFRLGELRAPLIDAVTRAGWTWQPVLIDPAGFGAAGGRPEAGGPRRDSEPGERSS